MVICLERGAELHMAQWIPLPLTVSCFSKIQIGFTFQVPAHPGSPGQRAVKRVCVCVCVSYICRIDISQCLSDFDKKHESCRKFLLLIAWFIALVHPSTKIIILF